MTTFIWTGVQVTVNELTGSISYQDAKLKAVVPDHATQVSYTVEQSYPGEQLFPDVRLSLPAFYAFSINGTALDPSAPSFDIWEIGEAVWSGGSGVFFGYYAEASPVSSYFVLAGNDLPQFSNISELEAFGASVSYYNTVRSGPYAPGASFDLGGLANMKVRERDKIMGDAGNETLLGGKGADTIAGRGGDDVLDGGTHADLLDGGKGDDTLAGGAGRDVFVFGKDHRDTITDFEDNRDTIRLESALWEGDLRKGAVLRKFAEVVNGDTVLDFGRHELTIEGVTDVDILRNDIEIA